MLEPRPTIFSPQPDRFGAVDGRMGLTCTVWVYVQANINGLMRYRQPCSKFGGARLPNNAMRARRNRCGTTERSLRPKRAPSRGMRYQRLGGRPSLLKPIIHARSALCGNREVIGGLAPQTKADQRK